MYCIEKGILKIVTSIVALNYVIIGEKEELGRNINVHAFIKSPI